MNRAFSLLCLPCLAFLTGGCGGLFGVSVTPHRTIATPPSNVLVYLSVELDGKPVDHLARTNFKVYENDVLLDPREIHLRLLPRDSVADGHTVLLLDLSGDIAPDDLEMIARGATHFVEKVSTTQAVTVLAYDGATEVRVVERYPKVEVSQKRAVPDLAAFAQGDRSRNLNGAVVLAIEFLEKEMGSSTKPVQLGTLVSYARGPDLAGRETEETLSAAVAQSGYELHAIAPEEADVPSLHAIAKDGAIEYDSMEAFPLRMMDLGMQVRAAWGRYYLLSYCSPARRGTREVKLRVAFEDDEGDQKFGSGTSEFSAEGFTSGCAPGQSVTGARPLEAQNPAKQDSE